MHIYHLYLFFCELLFMSSIHFFFLLKYLLFTCKKAEHIRDIQLSITCVKNTFFLLGFSLPFNLKIIYIYFFLTEGPFHFYNSNLAILFKVIFSCLFFESFIYA